LHLNLKLFNTRRNYSYLSIDMYTQAVWPWLLTSWSQVQCVPRSCHTVSIYRVWCW